MNLTAQQLTTMMSGNKYLLDVNKVRDVKLKIFEELEIKQKVHLLFENKLLNDQDLLKAIGITEDTCIQTGAARENRP